ncbi:MAG: phytoene/squalene synthase family protein [Gammaproteobacteria bacterium]
MARADDLAYQRIALDGVSRTFALTIPQLPDPLRDAVGNAYLLCRIADTIEDDARMPAADKRAWSEQFIQVVEGTSDAGHFARTLAPLLAAATPAAERDLVARTDTVIRITHAFNDEQRRAMARCVRIMARGMADFQDAGTLDGLPNLPAMDRYCYFVAGVVGEMLTDLFCDYSEAIGARRERLSELAISFGQGLQMTNILKDIWEDRARGACWLPQSVFDLYGYDLRTLSVQTNDARFQAGLADLIAVARGHLENALAFTLTIPAYETGIRRFCLWALGMAVLTLRKLNDHRDFTNGREVKITRRTVALTTALTSAAVRSDLALRSMFALAARGLPETISPQRLAPTG